MAPPVDNFPLGDLSIDSGMKYSSPIALLLAARSSQDSATLAHCLKQKLQSALHSTQRCVDEAVLQLAHELSVAVDNQDWLTVTVSEQGLARWLWEFTAMPVAPKSLPHSATLSAPNLQTSFPLCDRLQLSLRMLLQWAYIRCDRWLRAINVALQQRADERFSVKPLKSFSQSRWGLNDCPLAAQALLYELVKVLDHISDHPQDIKNGLRQGYTLAAAVYAFDAAMPLAAVARWPQSAQVWGWHILEGARNALAVIMVELLGAAPLSNL